MSDISNSLEPEPETGSLLRTQLEAAQAKARELEASNTQIARENHVLKAGLGDLAPEKLEALSVVHKGDMTPEALRATAEKLGFVEVTPEIAPDVEQGHQAIQQARAGAEAGSTSSYDAEVAAARNEQELFAVMEKYNSPRGHVM